MDDADPGGGQAELTGDLGRHGRGVFTSSQELEDLPVGLLDSGPAKAVATGDRLGAEVWDDRQARTGHGATLRTGGPSMKE